MSATRTCALGAGFLFLFLIAYFASDWRYWYRYAMMTESNDAPARTAWYKSLEKIEGAEVIPLVAASSSNRTISEMALEKAKKYAESFDSFTFLVSHRGVLQLEFYGNGFDPNYVFDSQSMHKGLLGIAFGLAVDNGFITDLDAPAAIYLSEWAGDERRHITLRHLLEMQSGLASPEFEMKPFNRALGLFINTNVYDLVFSVPAARPPGLEFEFNHINSQALHWVLTRATGMRYAEFLSKYLWIPIGGNFGAVRLDSPGGNARTMCCLQTTARDWIRIGHLIVNNGLVGQTLVLSKEWIDQLTAGTNLNPHFGFHVWTANRLSTERLISNRPERRVVLSERYQADDVIFVEGRGGQRLYMLPSKDLVIYRQGMINYSWDDPKIVNIIIAGIHGGTE